MQKNAGIYAFFKKSKIVTRAKPSLPHPTPIEGEGGGGQNQPVEFHFFLLGNPGIVIQPLKSNCKVIS